MGLTDLAIRKLIGKEKQYSKADEYGLYVRVNPLKKNTKELPTKTFIFRYQFLGEQQPPINIGRYGQWTLSEARVRRDMFIDQLNAGTNPKDTTIISGTFEDAGKEWLSFTNNHKGWVAGTLQTNKTRLGYAIKAFGEKDVTKVNSDDVFKLCRKIELGGHVDNARRVMSVISQVILRANCYDVTVHVKQSLSKHTQTNHPHILDHEEIGLMLRKIDESPSEIETKLTLMMVAHTFVRQRMWREAEWKEIKGDMWHVPAEHMKNKKPFLVPLSRQVLEIFDAMRELTGDNKYIFSYRHKPDKMLSKGTLAKILKTAGYKGRQTPHGFRTTASTCLNQMRYDKDSVEIQLAHIDGSVRGVYNKYEALDLRIPMMQGYSDWLDSLQAVFRFSNQPSISELSQRVQ